MRAVWPFICVAFLCLFSVLTNAQTEPLTLSSVVPEDFDYQLPTHSVSIVIRPKFQRLYVIDQGVVTQSYPISTSAKGLGSAAGSYQTPTGLHHIQKKIGEGAPLYTIFKHRVNTKKTRHPEDWDGQEDLVLTRIMHLKGLEPGLNSGKGVDSYRRCIYIHGTPDEKNIGQPASHGCIRMLNEEVVLLFESVDEGTIVVIVKEEME